MIGVARHSETEEELVVYRQEYSNHGLWVRPKAMFVEMVEVEGQQVPRFKYIGGQAAEQNSPMEVIILIGIQGSGKSSFYKARFADTHVRINLDMLKTRHREKLFFDACVYYLEGEQNPQKWLRRASFDPKSRRVQFTMVTVDDETPWDTEALILSSDQLAMVGFSETSGQKVEYNRILGQDDLGSGD